MKKLSIILLNAILLLSVSACSNESKSSKDSDSDSKVKTNVPGVRDRDVKDDKYQGKYSNLSQQNPSMNSNHGGVQNNDDYAVLNDLIYTEKSMLPLDSGIGLIVSDVYISGNDVVHVCDMNESYFDVFDPVAAKNGILNGYKSVPSEREFAQICKKAGVNPVYIYRGSESGRKHTVRINNNEL